MLSVYLYTKLLRVLLTLLYALSITFSQFLWELTSEASSVPPDDVVKMWIDRLSEMLGVSLYYSKHVINSLVV